LPETQGHHSLPGILTSIVVTKRAEVERLGARADEVEASLSTARPPRDFRDAIARGGVVSLIAECKRRSPGAGVIRQRLDPVELTLGYESAGASALSVLTDETYFGGSLADLSAVAGAVSVPILRKDFTLDALQVLEARGAGADAVLLIVRILEEDALQRLHTTATALGMAALVEVHDEAELDRALAVGADLIGINNRDLSTFTTDLETTTRLLEQLSDDVLVVSESGIRTRADVERLAEAGVDAILVGEALLAAPDPNAVAATLVGVPNAARSHG
jgi:indole-3-glycerol phosphate synthase